VYVRSWDKFGAVGTAHANPIAATGLVCREDFPLHRILSVARGPYVAEVCCRLTEHCGLRVIAEIYMTPEGLCNAKAGCASGTRSVAAAVYSIFGGTWAMECARGRETTLCASGRWVGRGSGFSLLLNTKT
jgi:hypothetical protein